MSSTLVFVAALWIGVLVLVNVVQVIRAPSAMERVLALDTLTLVLVGLLALSVRSTGWAYYLDAALILALLSFVGTLAAARFQIAGRVL